MTFDFSVISNNSDILALAISKTIAITFISVISGTLLGFAIGTLAFSKNRLIALVAKTYISVFLAVPVLVLMIWFYYVLPQVTSMLRLEPITIAIASLSLSLSAFVAQIFKSGMNSIEKGEVEVAYYLGFQKWQVLRYVIYPQVILKMLPALLGQYITCYKLTPLASIISVNDILHTANSLIAQTYRPIEIYTSVALLFLLTILPLNYLVSRIETSHEKVFGKGGY